MSTVKKLDPRTVRPAWVALHKAGVTAIRTETQYAAMHDLLNELIDEVRGEEAHPLADLLELVGDLIDAYETRHHPMPEGKPREVLRILMEEHHLTQSDLPELGSQGVVSEILSGKREINARQARALAQRFGVAAATFI